MHIDLSTKLLTYAFVVSICVDALHGVAKASESTGRMPRAVAPGIYKSPPPGIHSVKGDCIGKIALTPNPLKPGEYRPYPVIYDCSSKTFEILKLDSYSELDFVGDLTLTKDGYYLHQSRSTDFVRHGGYFFYDRSGTQTRALVRADLDAHDLIVNDQYLTYLKYVPDRESARCGGSVPLDVEIITESLDGKVFWTWSSKGRISIGQKVATVESTVFQLEDSWKSLFRPIRNCYTAIARRVLAFETPKWFIQDGRFPLLQVDHINFIQANSIQWVEPSGDILVSARFLDTVFLIDRKTGNIKWSLGGKFAKATLNRPVDDPRGGFSHQHSAKIVGKTLWLFDNGNLYRDLPSRAVGYQIDSSPSPNRLLFEFPEPNGKQRRDMGSVQVLKNDELLIGWGGVKPNDRHAPQRAVSVVRLSDGKEVFVMDFSPGWASYRANALQR